MSAAPVSAPIRPLFDRVEPDLVAAASEYQAAILADVAGRRGTMHGRIQGLTPSMRVAGPAYTVETRPGDNLAIHAALQSAEPGDVIVVDGGGDLSCALTGEIMAAYAASRGIAGFVIDGAVRDTATLTQGEFPVFAAGANPCGPTKGAGGRLGVPISVGGTSVNPGDLVIGDSDGVVVIPCADVAEILELAKAKVESEVETIEAIRTGTWVKNWESELSMAGMLD